MKKILKIILIILVIIIITFIIDFVCILNLNHPIFAIKDKNNVYRGIFYDTYNCLEFSVPQIMMKGAKFTCVVNDIKSVLTIKDKTMDIKDFSCDQALEKFYEDNEYEYFYNCIKGEYVVVKYSSGEEETVKDALKNNSIKIIDLDNYNISYVKIKKY